MATDFVSEAYDKIYGLLQAGQTGVDGVIRTWLQYSTESAIELRKVRTGPELPMLELDIDNVVDSLKAGKTPTFGGMNAVCQFVRTITATFKLTLTVDKTLLSATTGVETKIATDLMNGGVRNLSIGGATAFINGPLVWKNKRTQRSESANSAKRRVIEMLVPVYMEFQGSTQLA